jgi:hypothetical protein
MWAAVTFFERQYQVQVPWSWIILILLVSHWASWRSDIKARNKETEKEAEPAPSKVPDIPRTPPVPPQVDHSGRTLRCKIHAEVTQPLFFQNGYETAQYCPRCFSAFLDCHLERL